MKYEIQGDHGGQGLGFVDFAFVVPLSAQLRLGWLELGRNARAVGQNLKDFKNRVNKM